MDILGSILFSCFSFFSFFCFLFVFFSWSLLFFCFAACLPVCMSSILSFFLSLYPFLLFFDIASNFWFIPTTNTSFHDNHVNKHITTIVGRHPLNMFSIIPQDANVDSPHAFSLDSSMKPEAGNDDFLTLGDAVTRPSFVECQRCVRGLDCNYLALVHRYQIHTACAAKNARR